MGDPGDRHDVAVVGAGISGAAFAFHAARAGRRVLLLERDARAGGCLHAHRTPDGYWHELGAHTAYNSYLGLLELIDGLGLRGKVLERGPARARFGLLRDGGAAWLTPPKVLGQLAWPEVLAHAPLGAFRRKRGKTMRAYFSGLVGPRNYERVLGPFFAAVPSQPADDFPAEGPGSLFKKRPRRDDVPRSFGLDGGLQTVCDAVAKAPGVTFVAGAQVQRLDGRFALTLADGRRFEARTLALATPPSDAAALLRADFPALAEAVAAVRTTSVESLGVVVRKDAVALPEHAFLVPAGDVFFSCVSRDPFPHPTLRGFTFHFRPGVADDAQRTRAAEVLGVAPEAFLHLARARVTLPSPGPAHAAQVAAIDRALAGQPVALVGNYFDGLAIEDCVARAKAEWARLAAVPTSASRG